MFNILKNKEGKMYRNKNEEIFDKVSSKLNPENFNFFQFRDGNPLLFEQIIKSMQECQKEYKDELRKLKKVIENDEVDYNAMRNYAKSLERKLGIDPNAHK